MDRSSFIRTHLLFLFTLVLLFGCTTPITVRDYSDGDILVAAHRASHDIYPENSIMAIKQSIRDGIDIVEIDVRVTRDNQLILMHDHTLDRTTTGSGEVEQLEWEYIKGLQLTHSGEPTRHKVPTFEEALRFGKGKILFDLDLKTEKIELVMDAIEKTGTSKNVFFFDSDWDVLKKVKATHPDWYLMPRAYNVAMAKEAYETFKPWAIHVDPSFASAKLSGYFSERGVHVWINALGDVDRDLGRGETESFMELLKTNPSIIQTDLPKKVKSLVRNRLSVH